MNPIAPTMLACLATLGGSLHADISHRKSDLSVEAQSLNGAPLEGATITIEMLNHAFRFGTSLTADHLEPENGQFDEWTANEVEKHFNSVTFGNVMKWTYFEDRTPERMLEILGQAQAYNAFGGPDQMRVRGHATIWGASYQVPADVRNASDPTYIHNRIIGHIEDYHDTFKNSGIDNFDLHNEPFHETEHLIDKIVPSGEIDAQAAEIATWFIAAKQADPNAILFINEYNILNFWQENDSDVIAYKNLVDAIRDAGGPIDGICIQAHMDRVIAKAQMTRRFDILAAPMAPTENHPEGLPGLRLEITEMDMNDQSESWLDASAEEQAQVTEAILTSSFEHPSVDGITIWGMNDFYHWRDNAIMYDDLDDSSSARARVDPVLKQSGQTWIDYVTEEWWQDHEGTSEANGKFVANTFKGTHRVTVSYNGESEERIVSLEDDQTLVFAFSANPQDSTTYDAWSSYFEWGDTSALRNDDPDNDGRSNLSEFVAGTDPLLADAANEPSIVELQHASYALRFSYRAADDGLIIWIEQSTDLATWETAPLTEQALIPEVENGIATYTAPLPELAETVFYRIKAIEAE